jgi:hypothetical protein
VNSDQQIDCSVEHVTSVEPRSQAWQFLLAHGKALGERFRVVPDELVLSEYPLDCCTHRMDDRYSYQRRHNPILLHKERVGA